jgi:hypothetical protein
MRTWTDVVILLCLTGALALGLHAALQGALTNVRPWATPEAADRG